jgi:hypothetical protein
MASLITEKVIKKNVKLDHLEGNSRSIPMRVADTFSNEPRSHMDVFQFRRVRGGQGKSIIKWSS